MGNEVSSKLKASHTAGISWAEAGENGSTRNCLVALLGRIKLPYSPIVQVQCQVCYRESNEEQRYRIII